MACESNGMEQKYIQAFRLILKKVTLAANIEVDNVKEARERLYRPIKAETCFLLDPNDLFPFVSFC